MADQPYNQAGELPAIQTGGVAPNVPTAPLTPAAQTVQQPTGVTQEALQTLMDVSLSPHEMTERFNRIKEEHISRTYGMTIQ